jgi:hypothetical protein
MIQNSKFKITPSTIFKNVMIIVGILFPFVMFLPKDRLLLNSSLSSIGFAEIIVFINHLIIGSSIYFIFLLLNRFKSVKITLSLSLVYLFFIDFDILMYKKIG